MNHRIITTLLIATLSPLLFLAFITQSLAESAEQQVVPGPESAGRVAATTALTDEQANAISWEAELKIGALRTVETLAELDSPVSGQINNSAVISSADLKVSYAAWPDPVIAGQSLTFTVAVTNFGPSLAEQVVAANPLPMGVTFNSSPDCTLVGTTITCNFGNLGVGETISTTILVDVDPAADGIISGAALVFGDTPDPNPANNSAVTTANVVTESDLGIVKSGNTKEVVAGTNLTYTLTISNGGPSDAVGVEVRDTLPAGVTLLSTFTSKGSCNDTANPVVCNLETLAALDSFTITIKVFVDQDTLGTIKNQAGVSSDTPDGNPANDDTSEDTAVIAEADLILAKMDMPDPVMAGENLTYTLMVTNTGPSYASNVVLTDALPLGVQFVSATPSQGGPCDEGQFVICALGTLSVTNSATIHVVVKASSAQTATLLNRASVRSNAVDRDLSNNTVEEKTSVDRSADLAIDVDSDPNPVVAGDLLTYTLTISNAGPSDATGIVVTNTLPAEVQLTDVTTSTGGDCDGISTVVCTFGNLSADSIGTVTLLVSVDPSIAATVYNTATVSSQVKDPLIVNNSITETTTVLEKLFVLHLPVVRNGQANDEPNDTCEQAYRISPNVSYGFLPEDQFDWYHFDTTVDGTMTAILSNFEPLFGQIALYKGNNCSNRVLLGNNGNTSMSKSVHAGFQTAGHFYVFVSNDGVLTDRDPYSLVVTVTE